MLTPRRRSRRPRLALLTLVAVVALAGCGGGQPHMARDDAASLIELTDRIPHEGPCAQARDIRALAARRTALVNAHRIPPALAESLSAGVNALVLQTPTCLPVVPAATVETTPPAVTVPPDEEQHGHGRGHGKHHEKHHKHGDEGGD
ncbi:MAG: hypothetical protein HOQ28_15430 [Thermoleophilia bacterium]|nr:hypothetical protein [Thermoleophilia bacterium]